MKNEFLIAITQLCAEKNLKKEVVLAALEAALESAYKRNFGSNQDVEVRMDATTGEYRVFVRRQVTEVVEEKLTQISLEEARALKGPGVRVGDIIEEDRTPRDF
ncbi:MAG: transcription termination/antitermination protein NusA, partial [Dehalococcoidia bacterium]|nr:transcription termination/antitermination protein NusA [Dehalococcoidia bacterium]